MAYTMDLFACGRCRYSCLGNGFSAASISYVHLNGYSDDNTMLVITEYPHTSGRAELTALVFALEYALYRHSMLWPGTRVDVRIYSDSTFAVGCVTGFNQIPGIYHAAQWVYQDVINEVASLSNQIMMHGTLHYVVATREQSAYNEQLCNSLLDVTDRHLSPCQMDSNQPELFN